MEESGSSWYEKQSFLEDLENGSQFVYYRPTLGSGNARLKLEKITLSDGVLNYTYTFTDTAYKGLKFTISCHMNNTYQYEYLAAEEDLKNHVYGYLGTMVKNHAVYYRDTHYGSTTFLWNQWGGYIRAVLEGSNHTDKVLEVLKYLDLEKVVIPC